mmetsp:Transcript_20719/g.42068  ORF Transcript_20719/g.42068 Transcript_20719/m.42068 type:complete len:311 (+) Transcript_20719:37-969(+)
MFGSSKYSIIFCLFHLFGWGLFSFRPIDSKIIILRRIFSSTAPFSILMSASASTATTTLVVGATGATGKHVVLQLLQQKQNVRAIARSKERLLNSLDEIVPKSSEDFAKSLEVTEASILDLSDEELQKATKDCDAVVSCLGHNMTFKGMYGHPRRLVSDAARRLCEAIEKNRSGEDDKVDESKKATKFILMGSDGVANPAGGDDKRSLGERIVLFLIRCLVPPHRDNEAAAAYIFSKTDNPKLEWTVVRPTDLINGSVSKYQLFDKPQGSLFGSGAATRANVAKSMVDLILTDDLWEEWKFKMPVLHDLN